MGAGYTKFLIDLHRVGSAHFASGARSWVSIWSEAVAAYDLKAIVDELERRAGLSSRRLPPPSTPEVLTARAIARLIAHTAFEHHLYEVRNGYDYGSYGGGLREGYFNEFPACRLRLRERGFRDFRGEPAFRFWFMLRNDEPRLAFEDTGQVWTRDGKEVNLVERRHKDGSLWPTVGRLLPKLMR
ncbi:MAG TPA: hypothetical protein VL984_09120 [Acidimicrobiales bacterium]|nr:hypothetical protein [Acidimicrobiales bacterium]